MDFSELFPDDSPEPQKPRKRGGQVGNFNARKHGFYTKQLQIGKRLPPPVQDLSNVSSEIFKMRQVLEYVFSLITPGIGLPMAIDSLRALSLASSAISRLYAIQFTLMDFKNIEIRQWDEAKKRSTGVTDEEFDAAVDLFHVGLDAKIAEEKTHRNGKTE